MTRGFEAGCMETVVDRGALFSPARFVLVLFAAFSVSVLDLYVVHLLGVETIAELLTRTVLYTVGLYVGLTIVARR